MDLDEFSRLLPAASNDFCHELRCAFLLQHDETAVRLREYLEQLVHDLFEQLLEVVLRHECVGDRPNGAQAVSCALPGIGDSARGGGRGKTERNVHVHGGVHALLRAARIGQEGNHGSPEGRSGVHLRHGRRERLRRLVAKDELGVTYGDLVAVFERASRNGLVVDISAVAARQILNVVFLANLFDLRMPSRGSAVEDDNVGFLVPSQHGRGTNDSVFITAVATRSGDQSCHV